MTEAALSYDPTTYLWSLVALGYVLAGIWLKALDRRDHPFKVWFTFFFVGSCIFLIINQDHIFNGGSVSAVIELGTIFSLSIAGFVMFDLAIQYAEMREKLDDEQQQLDQYPAENPDDYP